MRDIVIVGTGDQARTAFVYLSEDSSHRVVAFAVHAAHITTPELLGMPVLPLERITETHPPSNYSLFVAIGFQEATRLRTAIYDECHALGYDFISYVSSRASCCGDLKHGKNCFIGDLVGIQPFVKMGDNVVVSSGSLIGHDVSIGDHVFMGPGVVIPGGVTIGANCLIGANSTFRNGITVASDCVIGAGALIMNNTRPQQIQVPKGTKPLPMKAGALANVIGSRKSSPS